MLTFLCLQCGNTLSGVAVLVAVISPPCTQYNNYQFRTFPTIWPSEGADLGVHNLSHTISKLTNPMIFIWAACLQQHNVTSVWVSIHAWQDGRAKEKRYSRQSPTRSQAERRECDRGSKSPPLFVFRPKTWVSPVPPRVRPRPSRVKMKSCLFFISGTSERAGH